MLLVLILEPLETCGTIVMEGRTIGHMEACFGGRYVEGRDNVLYIHV